MRLADPDLQTRIPLSISQQNIYRGVLQDGDPTLYLIGRSYQLRPVPLADFRAALAAAILSNPVQLCMLEDTGAQYPDLVPRLHAGDLMQLKSDRGAELVREWDSGILTRPLVRYTLSTDANDHVVALDLHAHHLLLDGGATGRIEADLGRYLATGVAEVPDVAAGLAQLAQAHRHEAVKIHQAHERLTDSVHREIADGMARGGYGEGRTGAASNAARGVLGETARITGADFDAITAFAEQQQIPLNVLVTAAAVAVEASRRQSTESLVVHSLDNRFGEPELDVATCLVNSVAQPVRFPAFAAVRDVVRALDSGYVKAVRRRWFREERYRRMYLAINRTAHVETVTLNYLSQPCAPELRPVLAQPPVTTDIGPIESMTVAAVLDDQQRTLQLGIWDRVDHPEPASQSGVAERIAAALRALPARWEQPLAMTVDEWFEVRTDGSCHPTSTAPRPAEPVAPAWFLDPAADVRGFRERRRHVDSWIGWLVDEGAEPGDVLVLVDDHTDKTIDLLIACHLAGCGYTVCDTAAEVAARVTAIAEHSSRAPRVVDVSAAELPAMPAGVDERIRRVSCDGELSSRTAYLMPTSGSTGKPKLVPISHGALAVFCDGHRRAYGWGPDDTVLQCAPLTSDISVEEIFGAAQCGATLTRSAALRSGDLPQLAADAVDHRATILDLPTAVWHLCCEQPDTVANLAASRLRQIVIGGEAVRPTAVDKWRDSIAADKISLLSSYGPTEATVVVSYLPLSDGQSVIDAGARLRVGRPIAASTVFVAFGEIVLLGPMVSAGYLGAASPNFGAVAGLDGTLQHAFATADRVTWDEQGCPVFAGRRDAVVKLAGKRVDIAEITQTIIADPEICDVAVEADRGRLGVWFQTRHTRAGTEDPVAAARIRSVLLSARVPGFAVAGVAAIPRKPNGKIDSDRLPKSPSGGAPDAEGRAAELADLWSRRLQRDLRPDTSLLAEGIGSLDLIRILPETRRYLNRHLSLLELISADSAAHLVEDTNETWLDVTTAAEIDHDLADLADLAAPAPPAPAVVPLRDGRQAGPVLVLGASGILGTGFAQALCDLHRNGAGPPAVLVTRSPLPDTEPWRTLRGVAGVRIEQVAAQDAVEFGALIRATGAATVVNAIGNTNVVVPYRQLRPANVAAVSSLAQACAAQGAGLVHLSTFVVNAEVTAARVTDPRAAPYPYAASKSLAELIVSRTAPHLDFTLVRLPRVLGTPRQRRASTDILVAIADACTALQAHPTVALTEEVTTGPAAAAGILGLLAGRLGRGITVLRGTAVDYAEFLADVGGEELAAAAWKHRLDESDWARRNPQRWSVIDAWMTLGMRLGGRSYAQYLADYPTIDLPVDAITELVAAPPLPDLVDRAGAAEPQRAVLRPMSEETAEETKP